MPPAPQPDIYRFSSYREFLAAWFAWIKTVYPRYSNRVFARRAGLSSPSLLLAVIDGKRNLTAGTTEGFLKALNLDFEAGEYFTALVAAEHSDSPAQRTAAEERVRATVRFREAVRLGNDSLEVLTRWYIAAMHEYGSCAGFQADPEWLAPRLRPAITPEQAAHGLEVLRALGMLEERDGKTVSVPGSFVTPHEVASMAAVSYHVAMLDRAREALLRIAAPERHFSAITVAISPTMLPELKREIDLFQERLLERCDGSTAPRLTVYQVNLNLFPLTIPSE